MSSCPKCHGLLAEYEAVGCDDKACPLNVATQARSTAAGVADWYRVHSEAQVRQEYESATDYDARDRIKGESFEEWTAAEGYIRGDVLKRALSATQPASSVSDLLLALKAELQRYAFNAPADAARCARLVERINEAMVSPYTEAVDTRPCTCHPDDNPPRPCPQKFALSECRDAASLSSSIAATIPAEVAQLCEALTDYEQDDPDGVFVKVSRQACDEAAELIRARYLHPSATPAASSIAHIDHPLRHFDRTCPACLAEGMPETLEKHRVKPEWYRRGQSLAMRILDHDWQSKEDRRATLVVEVACDIRDAVEEALRVERSATGRKDG